MRGPVERPKRPQCGEGPRRAQALAAALARGAQLPRRQPLPEAQALRARAGLHPPLSPPRAGRF